MVILDSGEMSKRETIYLRVAKGALVPADGYAAQQLRERKYNMNDVIRANLTKLRNPKFNRLVHRIGQLVVANIETFHGLDAHAAIKRLQLESGTQCDEIAIMLDGYGMIVQRVPRSLSFDTLDESEFNQAARDICRHIAKKYWPTLSPEQIESMAQSFVEES